MAKLCKDVEMRYRVAQHRNTGEWYYVLTLDGHYVYGERGFMSWEEAIAVVTM
jgi:hypothetical protein